MTDNRESELEARTSDRYRGRCSPVRRPRDAMKSGGRQWRIRKRIEILLKSLPR